jgi:hypothetical protein
VGILFFLQNRQGEEVVQKSLIFLPVHGDAFTAIPGLWDELSGRRS